MKYRQGFVSNSSTCSFVVIGFVFDREKIKAGDLLKSLDYEKWKKVVESEEYKECVEDGDIGEGEFLFRDEIGELGICITDDEYDGAPAGKTLIGYEFESDEHSSEVHDITEVMGNLLKLKKELIDYIPVDSSLKLVNGVRVC